jgi:hypothetical protein
VLVAHVPVTEAVPDTELLERLVYNEATHLVLAEYAIKDESFVDLHRLVPIGGYEHPFVLICNGGDDFWDQYLVFKSWRAAEDAFAWWVEFLRECHRDYCEEEPAKCLHAPPYETPTPKTVRRKAKKVHA